MEISIYNFKSDENYDCCEMAKLILHRVPNFEAYVLGNFNGRRKCKNDVTIIYGKCQYKSHNQTLKFVFMKKSDNFLRVMVHGTKYDQKIPVHEEIKICT